MKDTKRLEEMARAVLRAEGRDQARLVEQLGGLFVDKGSRVFTDEVSYRFTVFDEPRGQMLTDFSFRYEMTPSGRYVPIDEFGNPLGEVRQLDTSRLAGSLA